MLAAAGGGNRWSSTGDEVGAGSSGRAGRGAPVCVRPRREARLSGLGLASLDMAFGDRPIGRAADAVAQHHFRRMAEEIGIRPRQPRPLRQRQNNRLCVHMLASDQSSCASCALAPKRGAIKTMSIVPDGPTGKRTTAPARGAAGVRGRGRLLPAPGLRRSAPESGCGWHHGRAKGPPAPASASRRRRRR